MSATNLRSSTFNNISPRPNTFGSHWEQVVGSAIQMVPGSKVIRDVALVFAFVITWATL
ncbi:hypothetical protein OROHE_014711 [Orobanche hederae]